MAEILATRRRLTERLDRAWPAFAERRRQRLSQTETLGPVAEKVAETILEDLFTGPLDWGIGDIAYQVGYADIELTRLGIKHLVVEVKRPGALAWSRPAVEGALDQAARYARKQKVGAIAVSDGHMFYAADVTPAGYRDRVFVALDDPSPAPSLWWISVDGIYRPPADADGPLSLLPAAPQDGHVPMPSAEGAQLHPRYGLPAACFAYAGDIDDPRSWHLPYRNADGSIDGRRLPKAIEAILSNYRGAHLTSVPAGAIPDVLVRLGRAAHDVGRMPGQSQAPASAYLALAAALDQLGRLDETEH